MSGLGNSAGPTEGVEYENTGFAAVGLGAIDFKQPDSRTLFELGAEVFDAHPRHDVRGVGVENVGEDVEVLYGARFFDGQVYVGGLNGEECSVGKVGRRSTGNEPVNLGFERGAKIRDRVDDLDVRFCGGPAAATAAADQHKYGGEHEHQCVESSVFHEVSEWDLALIPRRRT